MDQPTCLYIDLRLVHKDPHFLHDLSPLCRIHREDRLNSIFEAIQKTHPDFSIFEYDYPDLQRLRALQQTKASFPSLPILMLTEHHSEDLAIWAFRTGVRDYLRSPIKIEELASRIKLLSEFAPARPGTLVRSNLLPPQPATTDVCFGRYMAREVKTLPALAYIAAHLQEKISLKEAARYCGLSPWAFSHIFRQEQGLTFQEFILRSRIRKALQLLADPKLSVTEVAYAVGFGDLSHFNRSFRRYIGLTPSRYRLRGCPQSVHRPPGFEDLEPGWFEQKTDSVCRLCQQSVCPWYKWSLAGKLFVFGICGHYIAGTWLSITTC